MPIQITELNISVSVNQPGTDTSGGSQPAAEPAGNESLVEECVEQILKILNDKKER
ncbi:DUF5908 family protein [Pontibacter qinzhouensis]|uniref:DUF5908 family protein n=1 Tax=Pontibacter qinzhouensis TaxID=2603253 RepID=UPI00164F785F|nr:DUF5908 family protein [Pontibacter qinzhouensis]